MRTLALELKFACCACTGELTMKVICGGTGLLQGSPNAAVAVACPLCEEFNELVFDTDGNIHQVALHATDAGLPVPSLN